MLAHRHPDGRSNALSLYPALLSGYGEGPDACRAREEAFERIRDALLTFTARGYFAQVMQREHHHRAYRKWQAVFQIERLYHDVRDAVNAMYQAVMEDRAERLEQLTEQSREQTRRLEHEQRRQREQQAQQASRQEAEQRRQREEREDQARRIEAGQRAERAQQAEQAQRLNNVVALLALAVGIPAAVLGFLSINLRGITSSPDEGLPLLDALLYALAGSLLLAGLGIAALLVIRSDRAKLPPEEPR